MPMVRVSNGGTLSVNRAYLIESDGGSSIAEAYDLLTGAHVQVANIPSDMAIAISKYSITLKAGIYACGCDRNAVHYLAPQLLQQDITLGATSNLFNYAVVVWD